MTSDVNPVSMKNEGAASFPSRNPGRGWRRFKKACKWTGIVVVALLALVLILCAAWNLRATSRLNKTIARIHATGQPLTWQELDQMYKASFTGDPSAKYYNAAFALQDEQGNRPEKWPLLPIVGTNQSPGLGEKMSDGMRNEVEMYLAGNEDYLHLLEKAVSQGKCRFDRDFSKGLHMPVLELAKRRQAARILKLRGLLELDKNDVKSAVKDAESTLLLAGNIKHEPILISQLVRIAILGIAVSQAEQILSTSSVPSEDLERLDKTLAEATITPDTFKKAMIGERSMVLTTLTGALETGNLLQMLKRDFEDSNKTDDPSIPFERIFLSGWLKDELNSYLTCLGEWILAVELPPRQATSRMAELDHFFESGRRNVFKVILHRKIMSGMLIPAVSAAYNRHLRCRMLMDSAQTALAIEMFRNDNSRLPESLDELVPKYRKEIPEDSFAKSGKLQYRKSDKGYVVYSVGTDGVDNEGTRPEPLKYNDQGGWDLVFQVVR